MATFLKNVDGCCLQISDLQGPVVFPSISDAMFAAFIVRYTHVPLEFFDDMLSLFQMNNFNTSEMKFRHADQFLDHIAGQRQIYAKSRQSAYQPLVVPTSETGSHNRPVPTLIVELVAEYIELERVSFHHAISEVAVQLSCDADLTLRNMALVQRSWSGAAQRCLWRRVFVTSTYGMRCALASPQLGPWVRDLGIFVVDSGIIWGRDTSWEIPKLSGMVLNKCPNVKNLLVHYAKPPSTTQSFTRVQDVAPFSSSHDIIGQVGDLTHLEALWFRHLDKGPVGRVHTLYTLLPRLHSLKYLNLTCWAPDIFFNTLDLVTTAITSPRDPPSQALKYLSLDTIPDVQLCEWLLNSTDTYHLDALEVSHPDVLRIVGPAASGYRKDVRCVLASMSSHITKLLISNMDQWSGAYISSITELLPSLQSLCLGPIPQSILPQQTIHLASTVHTVRFHYRCVPQQDDLTVSILSEAPHIRELMITYGLEVVNANGVIQGPDYPSTESHCNRNGVKFSLMYTDVEPSLLDM